MAYEDMTYEFLLKRNLDRIKEKDPNVDTRQSSVIYNTLAADSMELSIAYKNMDNTRKESYIETASREYKLERCKEQGIDVSIFEASYGTFKAVFNIPIEVGSRWNLDLYNYVVKEYIPYPEDVPVEDRLNYEYELQCETIGSAPNNVRGLLTPIGDTPSGLYLAELTDMIIGGEDEVSDLEITNYYFNHINGVTTDGNVAQYKQWCKDFDGIGNFKIFPLWNGVNSVKISILDVGNRVASEELINEFQEFLDPNVTGMGDGKAPIGAYVTVTTATEKSITISADILLNEGFTNTADIDDYINKYFSEISYTEETDVNYMKVGAVILECPAVKSINNLLLNGDIDDVQLGDMEIPSLGETTWRTA